MSTPTPPAPPAEGLPAVSTSVPTNVVSPSPTATPAPTATPGTPAAPTPPPASAAANRFNPPKLPPPPKENPFIYLGIPQWVFDYRPKAPSRNMSIFLTVSLGLTAAYVYDRRECKRIQDEYIEKVKWMSEESLDTTEMARKVRILAARVPEDGEVDRASRWFKRYMRPYFMASGTDYTITQATAPGGLGRLLINEFRARRLSEAAVESIAGEAPWSVASTLHQRDLQEQQNELDGGLVVMGRGSLKEYLWALRKGYGEEIDLNEEARLQGLGLAPGEKRKDARWEREEELVRLQLDAEDALMGGKAPFDEPEPEASVNYAAGGADEPEKANPASGLSTLGYVPYGLPSSSRASTTAAAPADAADSQPRLLAPRQLPPQPPLLLVPFAHAFGIQRWPEKMALFFYRRADTQVGAEMALSILNNKTRSFDPPVKRNSLGELEGILDEKFVEEMRVYQHKDTPMVEGVPTGSPDLDFRFDTEEPYHFRRSYRKIPSNLEYQRRDYYEKELAPRIKVARELANGRTPTKAETNNPPKIESELRKERLEKEVRWRQQLQGWAVVRAGSGIAWEEKWGNLMGNPSVFRVFTKPDERDLMELDSLKKSAEAEKARKTAVFEALETQA